jgi:diacylglycerol kinase (ATP)
MSGFKNQRFRARLGFALRGLVQALRSEASLKLQALAGVAALVVLLVLRPAAVWWALVFLASALVMAAELLNTAIEHLADLLHPQHSPGIRLVKDCAAAGVLIAVLGALGVGAALLVHLLSGAP